MAISLKVRPLSRPIAKDGLGPAFSHVLQTTGQDSFAKTLLTYLHQAYQAEHMAVLQLRNGVPALKLAASLDGSDLAARRANDYIAKAYWQSDPLYLEVYRSIEQAIPSFAYINIDSVRNGDMRERLAERSNWYIQDSLNRGICGERAVICSGDRAIAWMLCIHCPSKGKLDEAQTARLHNMALPLLSVVAQHDRGINQEFDRLSALTSRSTIERVILHAPQSFPKREAEVCARIVYGMSTAGIALELGISEETVITYRKRIYRRLSISSQHELLFWYVMLLEQQNAA